jgi:hypothetical protein
MLLNYVYVMLYGLHSDPFLHCMAIKSHFVITISLNVHALNLKPSEMRATFTQRH